MGNEFTLSNKDKKEIYSIDKTIYKMKVLLIFTSVLMLYFSFFQ